MLERVLVADAESLSRVFLDDVIKGRVQREVVDGADSAYSSPATPLGVNGGYTMLASGYQWCRRESSQTASARARRLSRHPVGCGGCSLIASPSTAGPTVVDGPERAQSARPTPRAEYVCGELRAGARAGGPSAVRRVPIRRRR